MTAKIDDLCWTLSQIARAANVSPDTLNNWLKRLPLLDVENPENQALFQGPADQKLLRKNARLFSRRAAYRVGVVQQLVTLGLSPQDCVGFATLVTDRRLEGRNPETCLFRSGRTFLVISVSGAGDLVNLLQDDMANGHLVAELLSGNSAAAITIDLGAVLGGIRQRLEGSK